MPKLNAGQVAAVEKLIDFREDPVKIFFTLNGPAGTGKTFTIASYIRTEMAAAKVTGRAMPRVYLSAPTHKAVSVIADLMEEDSLQVDCGTIHSLLGLYLTANNELKHVADGGRDKLGDYALIFADEGSMIGSNLFEKFTDKLAPLRVKPKVIFIGDRLQLDPVKEAPSPIFDFVEATLTEQMRQVNDNPINELIGLSREHVEDPRPMPRVATNLNKGGDGIHVVKAAEFKEMVLANFECEDYAKDSHYCKVLAWRNVEVQKWNSIIREQLLGRDAEQIVVGEVLVLQNPVLDMDDRLLMHTEQEVEVAGLTTDVVEEDHFDFGHRSFKVWVVHGKTKDNIFGSFDVLHEDSFEDFAKYEKILKNAAFKDRSVWKDYWTFKDQFVTVRSPYACTVHKSQGSSFSNVFVVLTDILRNQKVLERNRLIYVGLSRARSNIVLNTGRMA